MLAISERRELVTVFQVHVVKNLSSAQFSGFREPFNQPYQPQGLKPHKTLGSGSLENIYLVT
jgi:hypothetical protein